MKKLFLIVFTLLNIGSSYAQTGGRITGKLKTNSNAADASSVTIALLKQTDSSVIKIAVADAEGNFTFENLPQGNYLVTASLEKNERVYSQPFQINTTDSNKNIGVLQLQASTKSLAGVTITAKKQFVERRLDKTIINVDAAISNAGSTAMEVLEKSPGVSIDKDGNISLKGKQGVIILIDGKQTYMGAQDLANYLHALPAANLEQIELMPNPSSKYDAAGNSGVINIKTKKIKQKGFNGSINSSYGRGKYGLPASTVNLNYKQGKFNIFSTIGANHRKNIQVLNIHREYSNNAGQLDAIFDQQANFLRDRNNFNAKLGVDFYATKKTTLGILFTAFTNPGKQDGTNLSYLKDGTAKITSIVNSTSFDSEHWNSKGANINLRHVFDTTGREFTIDVDMLQYKAMHSQSFLSENYSKDWVKQNEEKLLSDLPATINIYAAKMDYVHPFKNIFKLEAGIKTSFVNTNNVAGYFNVIAGNNVVDNEKTNQFKYQENINAAYLNLSKDWKKWTVQAGLRLENTNYNGSQFGNPVKPDSSFKRSYTNLFPTFFAGYKLNEKNEFGFSYGRRISRPDYESLNPFIFFIDKYTYEAGNPFLKPMYANVFELSHTYNKFLTTTFNYSHNKDMFNEYFEQAGYATIVRQNNYGRIDDISLTANAQITPAKWWTLMPYAEFNYNKVNSTLNGFALKTTGSGVTTNINNQFKFKKGWGAELSGFYRSAMKRGQFDIANIKQMNVAVSKQILKTKGSVKLSLNDIFKSNKPNGTIIIQNTLATFSQQRDSRQVFFTFNYRFGKPIKAQRRNSGGAGDEQNRVKGGS